MKKFGTPTGDWPGSDSEKVGFDVFGAALRDGGLALCELFLRLSFFRGARLWCLAFFDDFDGDWPWLEGLCGDDELGCGVVLVVVVLVLLGTLACEGEVEVELEVVVEDELEDDDGVEVVVVVVVVVEVEVVAVDVVEVVDVVEELEAVSGLVVMVVVVVVVVVVAPEDGVVDVVQTIFSKMAAGRCRSGITPGVASTGTCRTAPPTRVTVTVQGSARATGTAAVARTTNSAAASASTARSRRLINKLARPLLPPSAVRLSCVEVAAPRVLSSLTLLTGPEVCNLEHPEPHPEARVEVQADELGRYARRCG
jgi:hypothetical protein